MVARVKASELDPADETQPSTAAVVQGGTSKRATLRTAAYKHAAAPGSASAGQIPTANSDGVLVQQDGGLGFVPDSGTAKYVGNANGVWGFHEFVGGKVPVWNSATTYNINDIVVAAAADDSRLYRSKINNNTSALTVDESWAALGTPPPDANPIDLPGISATGAQQYKLLAVHQNGTDMEWVYVTPRTMNAGTPGINAVLISEGSEQMRWGLVDTSQLRDGSVTQSKLATGVSLPVAFSTLTGIGGTQENGKVVVATSATTQEWQTPSQASVADGSITDAKISPSADIDLDKLDIKGSKSAGKIIKVSGNGNDFEYADDATGGGGGGATLPTTNLADGKVLTGQSSSTYGWEDPAAPAANSVGLAQINAGSGTDGQVLARSGNNLDWVNQSSGGESFTPASRAEVRAGTLTNKGVTPYSLNRMREELIGTYEAQFGDWLTKQSISNTNLQTLATQAQITLHTSGDSRTINPSGATELAMISNGVTNLPATIVHGLIFYYGGDTTNKWLYAQENATSIKFYKLVSNTWTAVGTTSDELRYHYAGLPLDNHYYPMAQGTNVEDAPPPGVSLPFTIGHRASDTGLRLIAWGYNITNNTHILITDQRHHRADVQAGSIDNDDIASDADISLDKLDIGGTKAANKIIKVAANGTAYEFADDNAGSGGGGSSTGIDVSRFGSTRGWYTLSGTGSTSGRTSYGAEAVSSFDPDSVTLATGDIKYGGIIGSNLPTGHNSYGMVCYDGTTRWLVTGIGNNATPTTYKLVGSTWTAASNNELKSDPRLVLRGTASPLASNATNLPGGTPAGVMAVRNNQYVYMFWYIQSSMSTSTNIEGAFIDHGFAQDTFSVSIVYSGGSGAATGTLPSGKSFGDHLYWGWTAPSTTTAINNDLIPRPLTTMQGSSLGTLASIRRSVQGHVQFSYITATSDTTIQLTPASFSRPYAGTYTFNFTGLSLY